MKDEMKGQQSLFSRGEIRGIMDYPYCPKCHKSLNGYDEQCEYCGQLISWDRWKDYLNKEGLWNE